MYWSTNMSSVKRSNMYWPINMSSLKSSNMYWSTNMSSRIGSNMHWLHQYATKFNRIYKTYWNSYRIVQGMKKIESWTKSHLVVIRKPSDQRRRRVPPVGGEVEKIVIEEAGQTNARQQQQQQQNRYHLWICNSSHHHVYKVVNHYVLKAWLHTAMSPLPENISEKALCSLWLHRLPDHSQAHDFYSKMRLLVRMWKEGRVLEGV